MSDASASIADANSSDATTHDTQRSNTTGTSVPVMMQQQQQQQAPPVQQQQRSTMLPLCIWTLSWLAKSHSISQTLIYPCYVSGGSKISQTGGEGAPTPEIGSKTYYLIRFFAKNCKKMKKLDRERGGASLAPPTPWIRHWPWTTY